MAASKKRLNPRFFFFIHPQICFFSDIQSILSSHINGSWEKCRKNDDGSYRPVGAGGGGCHALPPPILTNQLTLPQTGGALKLPPRIARPFYGPILYHYYKPLTVVARIPRNLPQLYSFLRIEVKSRYCV